MILKEHPGPQSLKEQRPPPLPANGRSKKEPPIVGVTGRCTSYREKCLENPWLRLQEVNQVGQAKQTEKPRDHEAFFKFFLDGFK